MSRKWTMESREFGTYYYSQPIHNIKELREALAELKFMTGKEHVELSDENVIMVIVDD